MGLEIDCRKCANLAETKDRCKLYGPDPAKAAKQCAANMFANYIPVDKITDGQTPGNVRIIKLNREG